MKVYCLDTGVDLKLLDCMRSMLMHSRYLILTGIKGLGAHIGFFDDIVSRPNYFNNNRSNGFVLGIDAILGIEYTLTDIPFVIGLDVKPVYEFAPVFAPWFQGGISFRLYF